MPTVAGAQIQLNVLSQYVTGLGSGGSEIAAFDPDSDRLFVVNGAVNNTLDIVNLANPAAPALVNRISLNVYGAQGNSVSVKNGIVAVAVQAAPAQNPGVVVFLDVNGALLGQATVGALPDMLTFTPDGTKVLVANEGEPTTTYSNDPEGTVSIIDLAGGPGAAVVTNVRFNDFNVGGPRHAELPAGVRVFGPGSSVAQDLEPEYVAVSADGATAWVTLQEANAIAVIDVSMATVVRIDALGLKNYNLPGNAIDPSDQNGGININNWPAYGMYQPDAVATYVVAGVPYLVTANEGDAREYTAISEEIRVSSGSYPLDPTTFPNAASLKMAGNMGRLNATRVGGNLDADTDYDQIWSFGARSFSIWNGNTGAQVFDSGDDFEQTTAVDVPTIFNSNGDAGTFDTRSDNKGPEPEGAAIGTISGRSYAFVCLERTGGVMVYDITTPAAATFVQYTPNASLANAPEGVSFVSGAQSPSGQPLVIVSNEVSGTVTVYGVQELQVGVTLARFEAINSPDGVDLSWATASETNHSYFDVSRKDDSNAEWIRVNSTPVRGNGSYTWRDTSAPDGRTVEYRLEAVERDGARSVAGLLSVAVNRAEVRFGLAPRGPNPFRGGTAFTLGVREAGPVSVAVYDAAGRLVRSLISQVLTTGRHELAWDGRVSDGREAPAGVFFVRATSGSEEQVLRVVRER
jgi:DNA-binding beta-propeller fold protein YncE